MSALAPAKVCGAPRPLQLPPQAHHELSRISSAHAAPSARPQHACMWCAAEGSCTSLRKLEAHTGSGDLNQSAACAYVWAPGTVLPDNNVGLRDAARGRTGRPLTSPNLHVLTAAHPACAPTGRGGAGQGGAPILLQGAYYKPDGEVANRSRGDYEPPPSRFSTSGYAREWCTASSVPAEGFGIDRFPCLRLAHLGHVWCRSGPGVQRGGRVSVLDERTAPLQQDQHPAGGLARHL